MNDDRQNMPIEIVVPVPIDKATGRLQAQHEESAFWAWKYQTRTWVKVKAVDRNTVAYEVKRVPKSFMSWPTSLVSVKGTMHRLDDYSTLVVGKPEMSLFWTLALGVFFVGMMIAGAFVYRTAPPEEIVSAYMLIGFPLFLLPIILAGAWWDQWRLKKLINNTFNDVPPIYGSRTSYDSF